MINILVLSILLVNAGIQSEGGHISQADINYSHDIYLSGNLSEVITINETQYFIMTEIPQYVQNPFINDGFLYYEII
jgi:hypothetical protein